MGWGKGRTRAAGGGACGADDTTCWTHRHARRRTRPVPDRAHVKWSLDRAATLPSGSAEARLASGQPAWRSGGGQRRTTVPPPRRLRPVGVFRAADSDESSVPTPNDMTRTLHLHPLRFPCLQYSGRYGSCTCCMSRQASSLRPCLSQTSAASGAGVSQEFISKTAGGVAPPPPTRRRVAAWVAWGGCNAQHGGTRTTPLATSREHSLLNPALRHRPR
jgi:hypothetical protein